MFAKRSSSFLIKTASYLMSRNASSVRYYQRMIIPSCYSLNFQQNNRRFLCAKAGEQTETQKLLEKARPLITDELKNEINAMLCFVVSGKNYLLDAHSSRPLKIELVPEIPKEVNVTMIADEKTFMKLAKGEMKSTVAFMSGKLKVKGDVKLAMKAEKIFKALQKDVLK